MFMRVFVCSSSFSCVVAFVCCCMCGAGFVAIAAHPFRCVLLVALSIPFVPVCLLCVRVRVCSCVCLYVRAHFHALLLSFVVVCEVVVSWPSLRILSGVFCWSLSQYLMFPCVYCVCVCVYVHACVCMFELIFMRCCFRLLLYVRCWFRGHRCASFQVCSVGRSLNTFCSRVFTVCACACMFMRVFVCSSSFSCVVAFVCCCM